MPGTSRSCQPESLQGMQVVRRWSVPAVQASCVRHREQRGSEQQHRRTRTSACVVIKALPPTHVQHYLEIETRNPGHRCGRCPFTSLPRCWSATARPWAGIGLATWAGKLWLPATRCVDPWQAPCEGAVAEGQAFQTWAILYIPDCLHMRGDRAVPIWRRLGSNPCEVRGTGCVFGTP